MPVPNGSEHRINIQRESPFNSSWPQQHNDQQQSSNSSHQETRTYSKTVTKRVISGSDSALEEPLFPQNPAPSITNSLRSSDIYSTLNDRRGSTSPFVTSPPPSAYNTLNTNRSSTLKSSSLVKKTLQEFEDGRTPSPREEPDPFANMEHEFNKNLNQTSSTTRRNSKTTTETVINNSRHQESTPGMEMVPSNGAGPGWEPSPNSKTDDDEEIPSTRQIITKPDGTKEFQLMLTAKNYSPQDIQVKLSDNRVSITGKHEERSPSGHFSKKSFYKRCNVPYGIRQRDLHWSLDANKRLVITAPFDDKDTRNRHFMERLSGEQKDRAVTVWKEQGGESNGNGVNGNGVNGNGVNGNGNGDMPKKEKKTASKMLGSITKRFRTSK